MHKAKRKRKFAAQTCEPDFVALHAEKMRNEAPRVGHEIVRRTRRHGTTLMDINLAWLAAATVLALIALILVLPDIQLVSDDGEADG